jgi:hypothetical protein
MPNPSDAGVSPVDSYDTSSVAGVVIDKVTGLWWQHPIDANDNQGNNCSGGCTQAQALTYCAHLNLGGHCDWRLPTRIELISIVDITRQNPAIDGPAFPGTPAADFWTASSLPELGAWVVGFAAGGMQIYAQSTLDRVRCVR